MFQFFGYILVKGFQILWGLGALTFITYYLLTH